jgi:hypothetical protein
MNLLTLDAFLVLANVWVITAKVAETRKVNGKIKKY